MKKLVEYDEVIKLADAYVLHFDEYGRFKDALSRLPIYDMSDEKTTKSKKTKSAITAQADILTDEFGNPLVSSEEVEE